ncbi:YncE family protein [Clostridium celatum]|uniref:YncE family protein n=1 Tax=Clostridium celatum TaxID=36834 RepID=UPI000348899A|nr:YncE family protein [Clostridium celatum]MCE9656307.1 YncE family protein [Clostridium celatum]MDU6296543.1 YncE family protein [Clostridium celatum]MDY3361645.1 YncE family protein [Clostridium celatum]
MNSIVLCNTGADSLTQINMDNYNLMKIHFNISESPVGPHGIKSYNKKIITANNYSDSISIFEGNKLTEKKNIKIGPNPNDLILVDNKIYVICGESNAVVIYDLLEERVIFEVHSGSWPHSIDYCRRKMISFVANLEENSVSIIALNDNNVVSSLVTPEYPSKVKVSSDEKLLYVCESYLGSDEEGYLDIFSIDNLERVTRLEVGTSPIDLCEDEENIYVSNFTDGTISVIDRNELKVTNSIFVGGMPRGLISYNKKLYIGDYLKGRLIVVEENSIKKVIAIESEPNAMTLF